MADPKEQNISASNPRSQGENTGAVQVNLTEDSLEIFNPNLALSAVQTFNTFNSVANKMFGIDARWFRAIPQQRSKDVIFQEYTLSNVEDVPLCLKVVVPDGNFPDSKYQYDLMGLEYEIPLEVQIDKKYWEEIAGFGTAPQKKDIVYLTTPNKLYQVESSFLKRGFMEQETTWIINLRKYTPEASRKEGEMLKETIDKYTVSESEIFGDAINGDIDKLIDDKQMSPFNTTEKDKYKIINSELDVYKRIIPKKWGSEVIIHNDNEYCGKILRFNSGAKFSMHFHFLKKETWVVYSGEFSLRWIDIKTANEHYVKLKVGDIIEIERGDPHQLICEKAGDIFEVSTQHFDDDSYRIRKGDSQK